MKILTDIFLTHYYHRDLEPFKSISCYSEKTDDIVNRLSQFESKAYGRFRNYEWYAPRRKETEQWLYKGFIESGGMPETENPIYFVLGDSEYLKSCYGGYVKTYQIRLNEIAEKDISFTLADSMSIHVSGEKREVLTKKDLFEYIKKQGTTLGDYIIQSDKDRKYIEAQIWNYCYFRKIGGAHV